MPSRADWRTRGAAFAVLYLVLAPLALVALSYRLLRRRRALTGFYEKLTGNGPAVKTGQIVVHGVSLGEVALLRSLVPELERHSGLQCILSTTTETGAQGLERHFPGHQRLFLPFDLPWAVNRFLMRTRPRVLVLMENELWPLVLCSCALRGVPVVLANARMSDRSFSRYRHARAITAPLFRSLALVLPQNGAYGARLAQLGVARERLKVCGSMKIDAVALADAAKISDIQTRLGISQPLRPILLLASTSSGEEALLLDGIMAKTGGLRFPASWQLIICPRHPERGGEISALCSAHGLYSSCSSSTQFTAGAAVVIVDEIGCLGALYGLCARSAGIAVVGGSLGSGRGGQNMLEAAAAGCCTVVGWDTRNQPDTMQLLRRYQAVVELSAQEWPAQLLALAGNPMQRIALASHARESFSSARGASIDVAHAISGLLHAPGIIAGAR